MHVNGFARQSQLNDFEEMGQMGLSARTAATGEENAGQGIEGLDVG